MATLKKTSTAEQSHDASGDESASLQLLAESQVSRTAKLPTPASVASANLLNAARIRSHRPALAQSSNTITEHTSDIEAQGIAKIQKKGKLPKPNTVSGRLPKRSARLSERGWNVYEMPESPEKTGYKLPQTVNHGKLHFVGRTKRSQIASQEPRTNTNTPGRRKSSRIAGEDADIDHTDWERRPEAIPRVTQRSKRKSDLSVEAEPTTPRKIVKKKQPSGSKPNSVNTNTSSSNQHPIPSPTANQLDPAETNRTSTLASSSAPEPRRLRGRPRKITAASKAIMPAENGLDTLPIEGEAPRNGNSSRVRDDGDSLFIPEVIHDSHDDSIRSTSVAQPEDVAPVQQQITTVIDIDNSHDGVNTATLLSQTHTKYSVFPFLDAERHRGNCSTSEAKKIREICNTVRKRIAETGTELDHKNVKDECVVVQKLLARVDNTVNPINRSDFKQDAYEYLFYSLARLLEAVYDWAKEQHDNLEESLPALEILIPFAMSIIDLNSTITAWNVAVPPRAKGEGVVRQVLANFILPLREFHDQLREKRDQLEKAEKSERFRQEKLSQIRRKKEKQEGKREAERQTAQRWTHWQHLHQVRQLCEPSLDLRRRNHLWLRPLNQVQELDANGVPFEREPFFTRRLRPFNTGSAEWSTHQVKALLDGLQDFAGPDVFENIFKAYCRPRGILRDFNVEEITSKAAEFRSDCLDKKEDNDWELPPWIEQIPVLP